MPRPCGQSGRARPRNGSLSGSGDAGCRPALSSATFRVPGTRSPHDSVRAVFPRSGRGDSAGCDAPPAADDVDAHLRAVLAYAATMPEAQFFSHVTAAVLWGLPLPQDVLRAAMPDVAVLGPGRTPRSGSDRGHRLVHASTRVCRHPLWGVQVLAPASTWATLGAVLPDVRDLVAAGDAVVRAPCSVGIRPHWRRSTTSRHPSQADGGSGWSGCVSRFRSCENGRHPAPRPGAVSR